MGRLARLAQAGSPRTGWFGVNVLERSLEPKNDLWRTQLQGLVI
jgi:hypothetical protein